LQHCYDVGEEISVRDVQEDTPCMQDATSASATASGVKPREQVFLVKTMPPRFDGDDSEFSEFLGEVDIFGDKC
jgi:hypothetical protein